MTDASADLFTPAAAAADTEARPAAPRREGWALMGDILSHRAGVPEHLLQWRRSMGCEDPEPWL